MKISFIGSGRVGSATAFSVIHAVDALDEIVLVDKISDLAKGEAMDLTHAAFAMERGHIGIRGTDKYADTKDTDIFVVTAGLPRKPGQTREELAKANYKIVSSVGKKLKKYSPDAVVITATNPVDAMNYAMWKTTGFARGKIIGMGGVLDSARLHSLGFNGFVVGAHGQDMVSTEDVPATGMEKLVKSAPSVIAKKGGTVFGPALALSRMIYAVVNHTNEVLPCSCVLDGEYRLNNLSIGVPARVGKGGVTEVIEMDLSDDFFKAAESIKEQIGALKL